MPAQFTQRKDIYAMEKESSIPDSTSRKRSREGESQSSSGEEETNHKRSRIEGTSSENGASSDQDSDEDSAEQNRKISDSEREEDFDEDNDDYQEPEEGEIYDSDNDESEKKRKGHRTSAHRQTRKPNTTSNKNTRQKKGPSRKPKSKPKSSARVERSSSGSDNEEEDDDDEGLDIPDQKYNFQPEIVYNEHWSKAQEKRLRRAWSKDDDFLIEKSYEDEKALWRKTTKLFSRAAPDLIEADIGVSPGRAISNPTTGKKWTKNPNWSQQFCNSMGIIVCLPYWRQKPEFLQYVLRKALHLRVGSDDPRAPKLTPTPNIYVDPLLDRIEEKIRDTGIVEEDQLPFLREIIGQEISLEKTPEHWKFQEYLKDVDKKGARVTASEDSCKLQVCDLDNIQDAWELYNKKNKLQLPTMVQYRDQFMAANSNKGFVSLSNTQSRQDDFKLWKKEWMLRARRDKKIKKSVREARSRSPANSEVDDDIHAEEDIEFNFDNNSFNNETSPVSQSFPPFPRGAASIQDIPRQNPGAAATSPAEAHRDEGLPEESPVRDSIVPETQLEQENLAQVETSGKPTDEKATSQNPIPNLRANKKLDWGAYNSIRAGMSEKLGWAQTLSTEPLRSTNDGTAAYGYYRRQQQAAIAEPWAVPDSYLTTRKCHGLERQDIEDRNDALVFGLKLPMTFQPRETFLHEEDQ